MRRIDQITIEKVGLPAIVLMENAGLAVTSAIQENCQDMAGLKVSVFAGKGNNGGDGFVTARHLRNMGADPTVFLAARKSDVAGDARTNMDAFINMGGRVKEITERKHLQNFKLKIMHTTVVVDALLGTGLNSAPRGILTDLIELMNQYGSFKVAVDVPSGVDSDSGVAPGACFRADVTVTFGLPKLGLVTSPARNFVGNLIIADISIPETVRKDSPCAAYLVESGDIPLILPPRHWDWHKGQFGHLAMACGSTGMGGAVAMAGAGAIRMGSGLVTACVPESMVATFETGLPEMMAIPLPQTGTGSVASEAAEKFIGFARDKTAVLIGPGLGRDESTREFVHTVINSLDLPMVIDADGLNCVGTNESLIKNRNAPTIITPHPGEMGTLAGVATADVQADRIGAASAYSRLTGAVVALKGAGTVIATPQGEAYINHTGNNGLATGGSGDVLAGMIAGVLCQGAHPEDAAIASVFMHGMCADIYAEKHDPRSLIPTDLLEILPEVITKLTR